MQAYQVYLDYAYTVIRPPVSDWYYVIAPNSATVDAYLDLIDAIRVANLLTVREFNEVRHRH